MSREKKRIPDFDGNRLNSLYRYKAIVRWQPGPAPHSVVPLQKFRRNQLSYVWRDVLFGQSGFRAGDGNKKVKNTESFT